MQNDFSREALTCFCLLTSSFRKWRNAVDLHHLPEGTTSLAPRPGTLVRLTFQNGLPSRSSTERRLVGVGEWLPKPYESVARVTTLASGIVTTIRRRLSAGLCSLVGSPFIERSRSRSPTLGVPRWSRTKGPIFDRGPKRR